MELTHALVQPIVEKLEAILPCRVTIMNARGIIVGSSNKERIGLKHRHYHANNPQHDAHLVEGQSLSNQFDGLGEDLYYQGEMIGAFGLVGNREQVSMYLSGIRLQNPHKCYYILHYCLKE